MILFVDDRGNTFNGISPYVHWIEGQLSVGLWYTLKLMILSDSQTIETSSLDENSIYRFIDLSQADIDDSPLDLADISTTSLISTGTEVVVSGTTWYLHQILMVCESDTPGEFLESFSIVSGQSTDRVDVGVDLYEENDILSINLSNKGLDLPISIQKAFLENNINEDLTDFALINRKFKELISNYIDVVDNKGSYKSLFNSLKWFEWGDNAKLFEIWESNGNFLEKELNPILSNKYKDLLYTYRKTTHLSLIAALQSVTESDDWVDWDNDRNPKLEEVSYKWSLDDLMLKISVLGAFFERYFMPIHLDLKRSSVESLIFTNQIKVLPGTSKDQYNYFDDIGVMDIDMDHTVVLGNLRGVAVGANTMFKINISPDDYDSEDTPESEKTYYKEPVGVQPLEDIDNIWDANDGGVLRDFNRSFNISFGPHPGNPTYESITDNVARFFLQLKNGIGVVVPITVTVDLPEGDGLKTEVITVYRDNQKPVQVIENRLFMSENIGTEDNPRYAARFSFNLVSTQEEKVSFSLALYSLSGHVWTGASSYEAVDVSGSYLDILKVENTNNDPSEVGTPVYSNVNDWVNQINNPYSVDNKNPYVSLYSHAKDLIPVFTQYLPYNENLTKPQFNQIVVVENELPVGTQTYDTSWVNSYINSRFWIITRAGDESFASDSNPRYIMLIAKSPRTRFSSKQEFIEGTQVSLAPANIKRLDMIFIPQLHLYESIEDGKTLEDYCFTNDELLCVYPQLKKTLPIEQVSWKYKNMTTLEEIELDTPTAVPLVADQTRKLLSPGYWSVTMYYKLSGSSTIHELSKNSAFRIVNKKDD